MIVDRMLLALFAALATALSGCATQPPVMPQKLFDVHAHLVSEDLVRYPRGKAMVLPPGLKPGASVQVGKEIVTPTLEKLRGWMQAANVEGGAVVQKRFTYGFDNSYILDSANANPGQFAPIVVLDGEDAKTPDVLRGWIKQHGVAGIRLTGMRVENGPEPYPWLDSPQALKSWQVAADTGIAVSLMYILPARAPDALDHILKLADAFPNVRIVLDHMGWPRLEGAPDYGMGGMQRAFAQRKNVYYKFTTINLDLLLEAKLPSAPFLRRAVDILGADHIMWGSDIGNSAGTYAEAVERVLAATALLTDAERRQVLHDTGKRILVRIGGPESK
jgi:predicted TIM-barrel fold metal-dependent hydrolase